MRRPLDDLERKLACAHGGHHESPPLIGCVGLVVAPAAEGHEVLEVEVRAALRRLHHVVDVEPAPHPAGLAAPAGPRQHRLTNQLPLAQAGSRPSNSAGAAAAPSRAGSACEGRPPLQHVGA